MAGLVAGHFRPYKQTYPLETVPEGFVELRRLSHGEMNELTDVRLAFTQDEHGEGEAKISTQKGRDFQFANSIVDHNLADSTGAKYDFRQSASVADLDPELGDEIAALIDAHQATIDKADIPN